MTWTTSVGPVGKCRGRKIVIHSHSAVATRNLTLQFSPDFPPNYFLIHESLFRFSYLLCQLPQIHSVVVTFVSRSLPPNIAAAAAGNIPSHHLIALMDRGLPGRQGYGPPKTDYNQYHAQVQPRVTEKYLMTMISERDAAIQQRNLALSEKRAVLAQRDLAVIQRDIALAERDNAIKERDQVLAHLQLLENVTERDNA